MRRRLRQLFCRHDNVKVWHCDHAESDCTTDWHNHGKSATITYCTRCGLTVMAETTNSIRPYTPHDWLAREGERP